MLSMSQIKCVANDKQQLFVDINFVDSKRRLRLSIKMIDWWGFHKNNDNKKRIIIEFRYQLKVISKSLFHCQEWHNRNNRKLFARNYFNSSNLPYTQHRHHDIIVCVCEWVLHKYSIKCNRMCHYIVPLQRNINIMLRKTIRSTGNRKE